MSVSEFRMMRNEPPGKSRCGKCNRVLSPEHISVSLNRVDVRTSVTGAKSVSWWHATGEKSWRLFLAEGILSEVHAGTMAAALHRAKDMAYAEFWLYELKLHPHAQVEPDIAVDTNDFPAPCPGTLVRYCNRWESPGSISICANPDTFRILSVRRVRAEKPGGPYRFSPA